MLWLGGGGVLYSLFRLLPFKAPLLCFSQISLFMSWCVTGLGCAARSRLIRLLVDISDKASVRQTQSQFLVAMSIRRQSANSCDKTGFLRCLPSNRTPSLFCSVLTVSGFFKESELSERSPDSLCLPVHLRTLGVCLCVSVCGCCELSPRRSA